MRSQAVPLHFTHRHDQCSTENFYFNEVACVSLWKTSAEMLSVAYSPKMEFLFARKMSRATDADLMVLLHGEAEQKRLAGPKQQKAKFKSALLYPNGFWYIYQQLWNVASGLFKIITNSNFSLRVHIIIIKRSPSTLSLGFFFPVGSSKICFLTNAFSPLYSLPCFLLMISC